MKFTESKLEHAFAELLAQEGYPHCLGNTLSRQPDEVLIEDDLRLKGTAIAISANYCNESGIFVRVNATCTSK